MKSVIYRIHVIISSLKEVVEFGLSRFVISPFFIFGWILIFLNSLAVYIIVNVNYWYVFLFLLVVFCCILIVSCFYKCKKSIFIVMLFAISVLILRLCLIYLNEESIVRKYDAQIAQNGSDIELRVTITQPPGVANEYVRYIVKNNSDNLLLSIKGKRFPVYIPYSNCFVKGKLSKVERSSDYFQYYYSKSIFYEIKVSSFSCIDDSTSFLWQLYSFKHSTFRIVEQNMNEPYASLLIGIIWGENRSFSPEMEEAFKITGTTHVIAASGYNVNVISSSLNLIFYFLSRKAKLILSILVLFVYLFLAGLSSSILRAVIMYAIDKVYELLGIPLTIFHIVLMTVSLIMLYNPMVIYDTGFLLSLSSTLSLILFAKVLSKDLPRLPESLVNTMSANLGTLGITIYNFKVFSIASIPVNSSVLIFLDNIMELGLIAIITFYISRLSSKYIFIFIELLLKPFVYITYSFVNLEWLYIIVDAATIPYVLIIIGILVSITLWKYVIILKLEISK